MRICVSGNLGCGKTTKIINLIKNHQRVLVYDFAGEYDSFIRTRDPAVLRKLITAPKFQISYHPRNWNDELAYFCQLARWATNLVVVFEECGVVFGKRCPAEVQSVVVDSRKNKIDMLFTAHRPVEFSRDVMGLASHYLVHQICGQDDIDYLNEFTGLDLQVLNSLAGYSALMIDRAARKVESVR